MGLFFLEQMFESRGNRSVDNKMINFVGSNHNGRVKRR